LQIDRIENQTEAGTAAERQRNGGDGDRDHSDAMPLAEKRRAAPERKTDGSRSSGIHAAAWPNKGDAAQEAINMPQRDHPEFEGLYSWVGRNEKNATAVAAGQGRESARFARSAPQSFV